jgi:hypothetical protein
MLLGQVWIRYAVRAQWGWLSRAVDSAQMPNSIKKFFFSNLFYKL